VVRPNGTSPAPRKRCASSVSGSAGTGLSAREPQTIGRPLAVAPRSFIRKGTPEKGLRSLCVSDPRRASIDPACSRPRSAARWLIAPNSWTALARSRAASRASLLVVRPARMAAPRVTPSCGSSASVKMHTPRRTGMSGASQPSRSYFGSRGSTGTVKPPDLIASRLASIAAIESGTTIAFVNTISLPPAFMKLKEE